MKKNRTVSDVNQAEAEMEEQKPGDSGSLYRPAWVWYQPLS